MSLHQEVDVLHFPVVFPMVFGGCSARFRQRTIWFIGFLSGQERFFLEEMPYVTVPSIKMSEIEINPKIHVVYGIGVITIYLSPNIPKISQLCYVEQHIESTKNPPTPSVRLAVPGEIHKFQGEIILLGRSSHRL